MTGTVPHARDLDLARAARSGSPAARHEFVEQMQCVPRFLAVINARSGRPFTDDELEDIVQETLAEIWRRLDSYAGLAALKTWAYRFCQQVHSSRMRSARSRPRSVGLEAAGQRSAETLRHDFEDVYAALERLDEVGARIVRAKHFDHLTFEEISRRLSIPQSSAKAHYQRALTRLREVLGSRRTEDGA